MVLSIKPFSSAKAATTYYSHGDYYGAEGMGIWFGEGAKELGLHGEFNAKSDQAFKNTLRGILPDGQILGRKTKDGIEHRPGVDLTFSCPKSFSIQMLLYADKEERAVLEEAMMTAVTQTLSFIEKQGYVMARANGATEKLNKLTFATFSHTTNRNLEPQAHVHCFLANVAKCEDGKFRSITYDKVFENVKFLGGIFRNELAVELKKLGYKIETKFLSDGNRSFELSDIHPKLIEAFSTRRKEILELCKLYGVTTKEGRDRIVINSRKAKKSVKLEDLVNTWKKVESNVMKEVEKGSFDTASHEPKSTNQSETIRYDNKVYRPTNEKIDIKQLFTALYPRLPTLLPEFGFVRKGNCYISTTGQKVDGTVGKKGKVYVYANNPGRLVDYTKGGGKSLWKYVQEYHTSGPNSEVFKYLASMAGFMNSSGRLEATRPIDSKPKEMIEPELKPAVEQKTWELVYKFSLEKISIPNNQVSCYLEQDRGYSKEIINKMGIGYLPSKRELESALHSCGVTQSQISEVRKALHYIGDTHKMVVPYYDKEGRIMGLAARNMEHTKESKVGKYLYTKGLVRSSTLLSIHEVKPPEIIIVEGMLDCLHAKAKGIENVVALGGTSLNLKQAELIKELGIDKITLCLDNDKAGQEASEKIVKLIHEKNPEAQIKLATLPEGIKDPDELLRSLGVEKAIEVITTASLKEPVKLEEIKEAEGILNQEQVLEESFELIDDGTDDTTPELTLKDLSRLCVEDITYHKSVFTSEELLDKIMKYSIGEFSIRELGGEIEELEQAGELLTGSGGTTTKDLLDKERQILKFAENGLGKAGSILSEKHFKARCESFEKRELLKNPSFKMNDQQRKALKHIVTSQDNVIAIVGLPGVGKSTVLNAVRDISASKIINILGLGEKFKGTAPTASAAKTLHESSGIESSTLHSFLAQYQGYIEDRGLQSLRAMRNNYKDTIIVLDESSLVPTRLMYKLLKLQDKFGFKLVLTGDTKQQGAVEAGKPFEQILSVIPSVKLNKILRQKDNLHREAVIASSVGDIEKTFRIHEKNIREEGDLVKQATSLYLQKDSKERDNTLLISPTRALRDQINNQIRAALSKSGLLQGKPEEFIALRQKDMSIADYRFAPSFEKDNVIKFNTACKNGINKGDYYKVIESNKITNTLILGKEGKAIRYRLKKDVSYENKFEVFEYLPLALQEGLKIKFTKNNKEFGLINSETSTITKLDKDSMTLKLEDGKTKTIPKAHLKHIDYGYCMTIHSAQGKTFDKTIAAISVSKLLNNQKSWLVTLSRHKTEFTALVEDKKKLAEHLEINEGGHELSAMELLSVKPNNQGHLMKK
jgi:conjugative relaxase-like TrwC/TraI family protein